jgi:hypothetical protein
MDNGQITFTGDLQRVVISPSDTLVLTCDKILTETQRNHIGEILQSRFPENEILIIDDGMKLSVASK